MHYIYPNSDPTLALMSLISGWFTIAIAVLSFLEIMSPYSLSRKGAQCFIIVVLFFATLLLLTHAVWHLYTKEEPRSRRQGHLDWSWAIIPRERFQEDKQENDMAPAAYHFISPCQCDPWLWLSLRRKSLERKMMRQTLSLLLLSSVSRLSLRWR